MHRIGRLTGDFIWMSLLFCLLIPALPAEAQQFEQTDETDEYIEYTLSNPSLNAAPPFDEMVPHPKQGSGYQIVERELVQVKKPSLDPEKLKQVWNLSDDDIPLIQMLNPGIHRGRRVASMVVHVSRPVRDSDHQFIITRKLVLRVNKSDDSARSDRNRETAQNVSGDNLFTRSGDHLFSSGQWYKIPIPENGIYQLTADYLENLDINLDSIDPDNLEIWTTGGETLPELNRTPRKKLTQIPIRVEGASDGTFDQGDRILFYANSPHQLQWEANNQTYRHVTHPYSNRNYVFLNISGNDGKRLTPANTDLDGSRTVREFRDFIWKEEELHKPEDDLKSGRNWYGERFGNEFGYRDKTILSDTLPGFRASEPVRLDMRMLSRSTNISTYDFQLNGSDAGSIQVSSIRYYNHAEFNAARSQGFINELSVEAPGDIVNLSATYNFSHSESIGFIDWIELTVTRSLIAEDGYLYFYAPRDGEADETGTYILQGFNEEPLVMDITDPVRPSLLATEARNNNYAVTHFTEPHQRFIAQSRYLTPPGGTSIPNQNLHGVSGHPDYLIITSDEFRESARELAEFRQQNDGLTPLVATQEQIFNEFSSGVPDIVGLRDFVKYFYNRALDDGVEPPQYLLFFGNTSYDYKNILEGARMPNLVFTFQSNQSLHRVNSFGSDDYFGMLDPDEGEWGRYDDDRVDIGIGRIPVTTPQEARMVVDKLKRYEEPENRGPWRNLFTFTADDGISGNSNDRDLHLLNADGTAVRMDHNRAGTRVNKIYEFAYPVENTGSGRRRPQASEAFIQSINKGTLVINYSGHGNEQTLSGERLFHSSKIPQLHNRNKPTIFVTATCSFGRYDDTEARSGAEKLLLWDQGGAIAAFTTTRVVYTSRNVNQPNNYSLNVKLSREMIEKDDQNLPARLGDIYRETKNSSVGSAFNSRKFILLGDPAMRIGLPRKKAALTQINKVDIANRDTTIRLQALDQVELSGMLRDDQGQPLSDYNGEANVTVYDSKRNVRLPDEPWMPNCVMTSDPYYDNCEYEVQSDVLFNGRASVNNGQFNSKFIVPKDINASDNNGRVVLYAQSGEQDGGGANTQLRFSGVNPDAENDNKGPSMDVYLNSEKFVNGNIVGSTPRLIVELEDQSGINTTGTGVGHEITAKVNANTQRTIVLNEFYTSELDDFTQGRVEYPMQELPEGEYNLTVQAWDVYNNPSQKEITFQVEDSDELVIDNLYNYPNPMNNFTRFVFEHNQAGNMLDVNIRIYTLSGRPVTELERSFVSTDSYGIIEWDGRGSDFDRLANGTYIYRVHIKANTPNGIKTKEKMEKLVIIQ